MLSTLLSRATRVVQEITRLGMDVKGFGFDVEPTGCKRRHGDSPHDIDENRRVPGGGGAKTYYSSDDDFDHHSNRTDEAHKSMAAYHQKIARLTHEPARDRYDDSSEDNTTGNDDDTTGNEAVSERLEILKTFTAAGHKWVKRKGIKGRRFPQNWWLQPTTPGADRLAEIDIHTDGKTIIFRHDFNPERKWQWYEIADADSAQKAVDSAREVQRGVGSD